MRWFLAAGLLVGCAARQSEVSFVQRVYRAHDPNKGGEVPWGTASCPTTFSPRVCDLLEKDRREAGDEVPRLDGDPLYDAQDVLITELKIEPAPTGVLVSFRNQGEPKQVLIHVVGAAGSWRIDEIDYVSETPPTSLTKILTQP